MYFHKLHEISVDLVDLQTKYL